MKSRDFVDCRWEVFHHHMFLYLFCLKRTRHMHKVNTDDTRLRLPLPFPVYGFVAKNKIDPANLSCFLRIRAVRNQVLKNK